MLASLSMQLKPGNGERITHHYGSLLHGVLMDKLEPSYAQLLHNNGLKPFSQYVIYNKEKDIHEWRINTLDEDARKQIIAGFVGKTDKRIYIQHKQTSLNIEGFELKTPTGYEEIARKYYIEDEPRRKARIRFLTPTTFKTGGEYVIFPGIDNIYKSLYNKWNSFYTDVSLESPEALKHLIAHSKIIGYNLRSTKFYMEKTKINAFKGEICLFISGPEALVRIANLLFAFGEYSGVGAKTSLGMGGIKFE